MRKLLALLAFLATAALSPPVLADPLDGVLPLLGDDLAAVAKLKAAPDRHAMLYFGDNTN